jgi:hypothetical protein
MSFRVKDQVVSLCDLPAPGLRMKLRKRDEEKGREAMQAGYELG